MREQRGWWGEIVQKTNTRHFPELKGKSLYLKVNKVTRAIKKYASL